MRRVLQDKASEGLSTSSALERTLWTDQGNRMFLAERTSGHMVEVLSLHDLFNLYQQEIVGRYHCGEEVQDAETFRKSNLLFLSGEELPGCWTDPHYREDKPRH